MGLYEWRLKISLEAAQQISPAALRQKPDNGTTRSRDLLGSARNYALHSTRLFLVRPLLSRGRRQSGRSSWVYGPAWRCPRM